MESELAALNVPLSVHPLEYYADEIEAIEGQLILSTDMAAYADRHVKMLGWLIAERRVGLKGRGCMKFLTCEDPGGVFEAIMFPDVYQQFGHLLTSQGPYLFHGQIQEENSAHTLTIEYAKKLANPTHSQKFSQITPPLHWLISD